jgi:hypothetical protein
LSSLLVSSLPACYFTCYLCDFSSPTTLRIRDQIVTSTHYHIHATSIMTSSSGKMMNAVRFHGKEDLRYEQVPEPECGKGQIKIKPAWCGICGRVCTVEPRGRETKTDIAGTVCSSQRPLTDLPASFVFSRELLLANTPLVISTSSSAARRSARPHRIPSPARRSR